MEDCILFLNRPAHDKYDTYKDLTNSKYRNALPVLSTFQNVYHIGTSFVNVVIPAFNLRTNGAVGDDTLPAQVGEVVYIN